MSMPDLEEPDIGHATDVARLDHIPTSLRNLPSKMPRTVTYRKRKSLPAGYKPGEFDVCCGRGKRHWNHIGNVRFRRIIQSNVERYMEAPSKNDKTAVVVSIVDDIRQLGGLFLKEDLRGSWYDIGDQQAREKVGHSLRDQVSTIHRQKQKQQAVQQHKTTAGTTTTSPAPAAPLRAPRKQQQTSSPTPPPPPVASYDNNNNHQNHNNNYNYDPTHMPMPPLGSPEASISMGGISSENGDVHNPQQQQQQQHHHRKNNNKNNSNNNQVHYMAPPTTTMTEQPTTAEEYAYAEEDDDDAQSDGSNERTLRRSTLNTSMIIDKFARRPSFVSAVADPTNSFSNSSNARNSSKRSSGWSFLNDLDFNMEQFDAEFEHGLEPINYKSV